MIYRRYLKRALDLFVSVPAIITLLPLFLVIAVLVRMFLGQPVLFRQLRPGLGGRPFELIKFRTMRDTRDSIGAPLSDAERLTPFGALLRRTSLDELPELWNVIRGEMSLVGPRPLLMEYLALYNEEQARRHDVLPGLTGWAQVNGRNALSFSERFRLDLEYVENLSFAFDLKVLVTTFAKVLRREGVSQDGHVTSDRFHGNEHEETGSQ